MATAVLIGPDDLFDLFIENFCESLTIQPPVNRLMEIKCIQNIIKKVFSENNSEILLSGFSKNNWNSKANIYGIFSKVYEDNSENIDVSFVGVYIKN